MISKFSHAILVCALLVMLLLPGSALAERLFSSGCEIQGDMGGNEQNLSLQKEWQRIPQQWDSEPSQISTQIKRSGLSSCKIMTTSRVRGVWHHFSSEGAGTVYLRFYIYIAAYPGSETDISNFHSATGEDAKHTLALTSGGILKLYDKDATSPNGTDLLATSPTAIPLNEWHMVEWMYSVTTGFIANSEIRLDGVRVMNSVSGGADAVGAFSLGSGINFPGTSATFYFDDIAINDGLGLFQNSWPGPGSIIHLQPDAPGDINQCNGQNYSHLDEVTPNDATDSCNLSTGGESIDVNVEPPLLAGIDPSAHVTLVQVGDRHTLTGSVSTNYNLRIKSRAGGVVANGATVIENDTSWNTNGDHATNEYDTPSNYSLTSYIDPETGCPWTMFGTNSIDNMQIGAHHQVGSNQDVLISTLWAVVEYTNGFVEPCSGPTVGGYESVSTALSKTSTYTQTKSGGFWAKAIAADKICLGSSTNCITSWKPAAKCRLEHHRVVARPDATGFSWGLPDFSTDISSNLCDAMLDQASKDAGWVSTGFDYANRVVGGSSLSPRVCYFTRLVCDKNVQIEVEPAQILQYPSETSGFIQ